jgi:tetratricopeptide (TPR) repeat protein
VKKFRKEKLVFLFFCFILVFSVYGRTLAGDFVFDDRSIADNYHLLQFNNLAGVVTTPYWTEAAGLYRPVTLLSYALNFSFFGQGPWSFHLVNLILYAFSGYLIFLLLQRVFARKEISYLVSILFLLLPIHSEAVANITGRSELLALFFSLLVFLELIKKRPGPWRAGVYFLLAIGSKETAIAVLPLAAIIVYFKEKMVFAKEQEIGKKGSLKLMVGRIKFSFDNWFVGVFLEKYFYPAIGLLIGGSIYFFVRYLVLGRKYFLTVATSVVENPIKFVVAKERIVTAFGVLTMYLKKSFWPVKLCSDYSYNQIPVLHSFNLESLAGLAIFLFFIFTIFFFWKRQPILAFGSAWFIFSFLPTANLVFSTGTIAGERLMYYPSVGLCIFLAAGLLFFKKIHPIPRGIKIFHALFWVILVGLVMFYAVIGFRRGGDWLTEKALFSSAAKCAPNSVLSRSNLGAIYYLEGNLDESKKELLTAQSIYDGYPKGINNLGLIYWKEGDLKKAREYFLKALSFDFPFYGAYENLALLCLEEKKYDEAKKWLAEFYSGDEKTADLYIQNYLKASGQ